MDVEVCYAEPMNATQIAVSLPDGSTVADAVERSGIAATLTLDLARLSFAVFGRRAVASTRLHDGDRVELLRPLIVHPMEARRLRAVTKAARSAKPSS